VYPPSFWWQTRQPSYPGNCTPAITFAAGQESVARARITLRRAETSGGLHTRRTRPRSRLHSARLFMVGSPLAVAFFPGATVRHPDQPSLFRLLLQDDKGATAHVLVKLRNTRAVLPDAERYQQQRQRNLGDYYRREEDETAEWLNSGWRTVPPERSDGQGDQP